VEGVALAAGDAGADGTASPTHLGEQSWKRVAISEFVRKVHKSTIARM
jgi:hypothetical protein